MGKKWITIVLAVLLLAGCAVPEKVTEPAPSRQPEPTAAVTPEPSLPADTTRPDKSETVYVTAAADGTVRDVTVETVLKNPGEGRIPDKSILTDIKNTGGEEEFTRTGEDLSWDNYGEDIAYTGKTEQALPVGVRLHCALDGTPITPEELAGRSGRVELRFTYENRAEKTVAGEKLAKVPFTAVTAAVFPGDRFANVEVTNGKAISSDGQTVAVGVAFPGWDLAAEEVDLPEEVVITADTVDFALEFTATVFTAGMLDEWQSDEMDELSGGMRELDDAALELGDGAGELAEGVGALRDGLGQYMDGVDALAEGSDALYGGTQALTDGAAHLFDGLDALRQGGDQLVDGASALQGGLAQLSQNSAALVEGGDALADAILAAANLQLAEAMQGPATAETAAPGLTWENYAVVLDTLAASLPEGAAQQLAVLKAQLDAVAGFTAGLRAYTGGVDAAASGSGALKEGASKLAEGIAGAQTGASALKDGAVQLEDGAKALSEGAKQLRQAGGELTGGGTALAEGADALRNGIDTLEREGLRELSEVAGDGLLDALKSAQRAGLSYTNFAGLADGKTGEVSFIIETAAIEKE